MRSGNTRGIALASVIVVIGATSLSAHRRDELLQAARIDIAADRLELELSLTPGIAVADDVIGAIDRDHDGLLSPEEKRSYTDQVMAATELRINGRVVEMVVGTAMFPLLDERRDGDRSIELRSTAAFPELSSGRHEIAFSNSYRSDISVYLANALRPESDRIVIASQHRDPEQQTLAIAFTIDTGHFATLPIWLFGSGAVGWLMFRLAGNKTVEQAKRLSIPLRVIETDGHHLIGVQRDDLDLATDPRAKALALADNRVGELDLEWDVDMLRQLHAEGLDLFAFWSSRHCLRIRPQARPTRTLSLKPFDGKYRRVKVEMKAPGYTVRHRSGYLAIPLK